MRRTIWICSPPTVATSTSGTGISPATPDHKANRSTNFDAISSRVSGVLAAVASLVSELDDVGFSAMPDPFLILERDQHLVVSACFSAQTPRAQKAYHALYSMPSGCDCSVFWQVNHFPLSACQG